MSETPDRSGPQRLAPARTPSHPSGRVLEALAFDDPSVHAGSQDEGHLASCDRCRAQVQELRAQREAFLVQRPPAAFMAQLEAATPPTWGQRLRSWLSPGPVFGVALAVALLLFMVRGLGPGEGPDPQVRLRGASSLTLHVSRGGAPAAPFVGQALLPGDVLRFVVQAQSDGYALVANLDEEGRATIYVPPDEDQSVPVAAGPDHVLPGSIALDDYVGQERIFLLWSNAPLAPASVTTALKEAFETAQGKLQAIDSIDLEAEISSVTIRKSAAP